MINQLVNPYTTSLTPEDVNFFQVNDANGRGMRANEIGQDYETMCFVGNAGGIS